MMMREKIKGLQNKFISNLLYGGIKKEEYKEIEEFIHSGGDK